MQECFENRIGQVERFGCAAHNLQLAIKDAMKFDPDSKRILTKVKDLVLLARKSGAVAEDLRTLGITLCKDFAVRWNSTYNMKKIYLKLKPTEIKSF
jgi:hypothetical protein